MKFTWLARSASIVIAVSAVAAACSGSGGGGPTATPAGAGTPTALATIVAYGTPAVNAGLYTFPQKGYAVAGPAGWTAQPNVSFDVSGARYPMDVFFAPGVVNGIQANISVTCLKPRATQATTDAFRDGWRAFLAQLVHADIAPRAVTVAGAPAYAFDYSQEQAIGKPPADKTDVVFVHGGCRWMISLLTPNGERAQYAATFNAFLSSFKLLS